MTLTEKYPILFSDQRFSDEEELSFLSNQYPINIKYNEYIYPSVEHIYQIMRCVNQDEHNKIQMVDSPIRARIAGNFTEKLSPYEWLGLMKEALEMKFSDGNMKKLLLKTADKPLIYINYWHDTFWGRCTCTQHKRSGDNRLGKLLMEIRREHEVQLNAKRHSDLTRSLNELSLRLSSI